MKAFYVKLADQIFPIFGATSIDDAKRWVPPAAHERIIETSEDVYINPLTGSIDFQSGWDDLEEVVKAEYSVEEERWIEA